MSDLISRDEVKRIFGEQCIGDCDCCSYSKWYDMFHLCKLLDKVPAVDATPVVHGEMWYDPYGEFAVCSICKEEFDAEMAQMYKYCPNCGAKMDGRKD